MTASREAAQAKMPVRVAENLKLRAEAQLAAAETALGSAISAEAKEQAESAKAKAVARIAELQAKWAAAKAELQPKLDAVAPAREAAVAAEAARVAAAEAARKMARELEPVSVFISRKTQRLYVRRAFEPILESPVTILDADRPIGTHVFTAMERPAATPACDGASSHWRTGARPASNNRAGLAAAPVASLSRRRLTPTARRPRSTGLSFRRTHWIASPAMVSPRSSLIISDEALSSETGKGTDFVVLLSGEPQGGIKIRRRSPPAESLYARPRGRLPSWRAPFPGPFSAW